MPAELRHRWGIDVGGEVGIIDLGDAALIVPGGVVAARAELRRVLRARYNDAVAGIEDPDLIDQQMARSAGRVVLDDRLLVEHLLVGLGLKSELNTTSYCHYRACRAAVVGAGGHLSGPFAELDLTHQQTAIRSLLMLSDDVGLPDQRSIVPLMAELSGRHPPVNLLNLEAVAAGLVLDATLLLSVETASGLLPGVLGSEDVRWQPMELDGAKQRGGR